jgi:hypothetical protein
MKCVCDAGGQVVRRKCRPQTGDIKIGVIQITAPLQEYPLDQFFRFAMVDKFGFETSQKLYASFHRQLMMYRKRVVRVECGFDQFLGKLTQTQNGGRISVDK